MTNTFETESCPACLVYIATGRHASAEKQESLVNAFIKGQEKMETFGRGSSEREKSKFSTQ